MFIKVRNLDCAGVKTIFTDKALLLTGGLILFQGK